MLTRSVQIILLLSLVAFGSMVASAQGTGADRRSPFSRPDDSEDMSKGFKETREKMRIEKEKKDHEEMLSRGEEVRRLSERLEKSYAQNGRFSASDLDALEMVEKNAKKIRAELGGDDCDEKIDDLLGHDKAPSLAGALDTLKTAATDLADELQKTTRFTISATAIQSSNAVLTVARFLRIKN